MPAKITLISFRVDITRLKNHIPSLPSLHYKVVHLSPPEPFYLRQVARVVPTRYKVCCLEVRTRKPKYLVIRPRSVMGFGDLRYEAPYYFTHYRRLVSLNCESAADSYKSLCEYPGC